MSYYFTTTLSEKNFDKAIERVTSALKETGFGVLSEIDMQATLKNKIDVDIKKYKILGACNPKFAHKALSFEDKIGLMLPCNIILQELENGEIEVAAIDPIASMKAIKNNAIADLAVEVQKMLKDVIKKL